MSVANNIKLWAAPATRSCFKNAVPFFSDSDTITLEAAKGERISVQLLLRNDVRIKFKEDVAEKTLIVNDIKIKQICGEKFDTGRINAGAQEYISFADGITYPDAVSNGVKSEILPNTTGGFIISFDISCEQSSGEYEFKINFIHNIEGLEKELSATVKLKIYNVTVPSPANAAYSIEHFTNPACEDMLHGVGYDYPIFSEKFWEFMDEYAKSLKNCRSNVYRIYPIRLLGAAGSRRTAQGTWVFDFTLFDRMIKLLNESGAIKLYSIQDPLKSWDGKEIEAIGESGESIYIHLDDPDAEIWAREYFTALYEHIKQTDDVSRWIMHIQDEPCNADVWIKVCEWVNKYMPTFRTGNPICRDIAAKIKDFADILIPIFYEAEENKNFYQEILESGACDVWGYCCCDPSQSHYLNRFIDRPAIQPRLISWATYSMGFSGFLHYGYSYWQKTPPFAPFSIGEYSSYKGDSMLIYPDPVSNSYKESIRYINLCDGAQDFELLKIVEKKNPSLASSLAARAAKSYTEFNADESAFLKVRHDLLVSAEDAFNG
ncbi:MAG: DUF4091 domain-containing protein [Clostridia bacterium]|nr:DUF4091 domain-containing protein [Clostridia bacterium]